jgi:hypothetical protein
MSMVRIAFRIGGGAGGASAASGGRSNRSWTQTGIIVRVWQSSLPSCDLCVQNPFSS